MTYPVMQDFIGIHEAMRLAYSQWGVSSVERVFGLLIADSLHGWLVEKDGDTHLLPASFWRNKDFRHIISMGEVSLGPLYRGSLQFKRYDFVSVLPPDVSWQKPKDVPLETDCKKGSQQDLNKGGAPVKYDWEAMWIEIVTLIHDEGIPETSIALRKKVLQWFSVTYGSEPSRNAIVPKIDRLWKRLKPERQ